MNQKISIILPAKNESLNIANVINNIKKHCIALGEYEILLINDGSTDNTKEIAEAHGARVISHPYSMGNGAAIKTGARNANGDVIVFMDADGQHNPADIPKLLKKMEQGYDMVVGARKPSSQASLPRRYANAFFNLFASLMTGHNIEDLTSGFRAVKAQEFRKFLYLLPNGFSYPTTSTMAFFRSGFPVAYIPIECGKREGQSHIRLVNDGMKFFIIILRIGALFSPMRLFLPISGSIFMMGVSYYTYTYLTSGRFTNMSALLILSSVIIFMIGILSEQVSSLHYKDFERSRWDNK